VSFLFLARVVIYKGFDFHFLFSTTPHNECTCTVSFITFGTILRSMAMASQQKAAQEYEAQKAKEVMSEAEAIDLAIQKRRAEGTPCTDETFYAWRDKFDAEMKEKELEEETIRAAESRKVAKSGTDTKKDVDRSSRLTGYEQFSDKTGTLNLEAMEAAAENAERDPDEEDDEDDLDDVDEDLFDVDDDDLDDLDFDDDDEEDEPDI
jgi:hypothetical protein